MIADQRRMKGRRSLSNTGTRVRVLFSIERVAASFWIEEKMGRREEFLQAVTIDRSHYS
jgi:hypothetical protein